MAMQDVWSLTEAIAQHENQLSQVQLAISASSPGQDQNDLISLESNIKELIKLTKENLNSVQNQIAANSSVQEEDPLAKEYALFKAELEAEDDATDACNNASTSGSAQKCNLADIQADLDALQGMKCQAPHSHQWGDISFHNALICNVEPTDNLSSMDNIQVRVMFTNPTHQEMLPCPYYLEGECRFTDEKCRYSHGELVHLSSLREYRDPDFSAVHSGARVLIKHCDNLWHRGVILRTHSQSTCEVKFESSGKTTDIDLQDILPLEESETVSLSESSDADESEDEADIQSDVKPALVEQSLLTAPPSTALGEWEKHTKGIGSRLMAQMGYVTGTGLGKFGEGRLEPVEAVVLPAGKSLDHCMELREKAGGDENLFKVERRLRRLKKKQEQQQKKIGDREKQTTTVFDFINRKLGGKRGNLSEHAPFAKPHPKSKEKGSNGLKSESSRVLNVVGLQVGEEIRRAERDLARMQESLTRHARGTPAHKQLISKMEDKQGELQLLKASEYSINRERNQRNDRKKLTVF